MKRRKQWNGSWKKSKYITGISLILAILEMIMIFVGIHLQTVSSTQLREAYHDQLKYGTLAKELKDCSDYLTNEVRSFAATGEMDHFENYWDEAKRQMNRERIIQEIKQMDLPASEERELERAKYFSDTLMHIEISSMRLVLEEYDISEKDYTQDAFLSQWITYVKEYPLEDDYNSKSGEKSQKVLEILYGSSYGVYKELIDSYIEKFQFTMNQRLDQTVENARKKSEQASLIQFFFGVGEIAVLLLILTLYQKWYIQPVNQYKATIERQHGRRKMFVEPAGVWELQQFAEEFNELSTEMLTELARSEQIERELSDAKRQAEKASHVKSQFLTHMSHELRTPLNTISGYLFLLEDTKMSGEQKRYTENMRLAVDILLEEINEILDYSKLESGRMTFENKNFSLLQLTETLKGIFENEAEQRNLTFEIIVDQKMPEYVYGDPLKLKQVLTNLIYNGFKFTKTGGVKLTIQGLEFLKNICVLEFIVEDTGIGIKKEQRQAIFEAFAQGDESITRKYGGTGLGLPICRRMIREMSQGKYTLLLESEEGKGSRFYFDMEFAYGKAEKASKKNKPADARKKRNVSFLIVDDNRINLILEAEILHKFGYQADVESEAVNVIKRMEEKKYDVVFLDLSMPQISGYELSRKIRENPQWKNVILVAMTANTGEDIREKVKEAGMNEYLPKPVPMEQLRDLLSRYTESVIELKKEAELEEESDLIAFHQLERQFYGDKGAVKELLTIFAEDNLNLKERLKESAEKKEWNTLEAELHRLKGISGNLLCRPLEMCAGICMKDVKKQRWKKENAAQLYSVFDQTLETISQYQEESRG